MRQAAGQVARRAHRLAHYLLGAVLACLLGLGAVAFTLSKGPVEIGFLARFIERSANDDSSPTRLSIGRAMIGWEGLRGEGMTPLELRLKDVRILDAEGTVQAALPDASASLSLAWLLRGEIAPKRLELRQLSLRLRREADGRVALMLGDAPPGAAPDAALPAEPPATPAAPPQSPPGTLSITDLLAEMMEPPADDTPLGALSLLSITGARITVEDAHLGMTWSLENAAVELRRQPGGGINGQASAALLLGNESTPLVASAQARGKPAEIAWRISLPEVRPGPLAAAVPVLAPLSRVAAPLRLDLQGRLGADGVLHDAAATLVARPGRLDLGAAGQVVFAAAELSVKLLEDGAEITHAALRLAGPGAPTLGASGRLLRNGDGWRATADLTLDSAQASGLAAWWPAGLAPGGRGWVVENVTAGVARNGRLHVVAETGPDFTKPNLAALSGTLEVADATVHWLRPMPPVEATSGTLRFSPAAIDVSVAAGRQSGTALVTRDATAKLAFTDPETLELTVPLAGPAADAFALLRHPRLKLFDRRPPPFQEVRGTLDGRVTLAFPLLADLAVEQVRFNGQGRLRDMRIPDLVAGKTLERAQAEFSVDADGFRANGTGTVAEIQARLSVEADFRPGPASQVIVRATAQGRPEARQLVAFGLDTEDLVRGPLNVDARYEQRRNGIGRVTLRGDLRDATMAVEAMGWSKPPGQGAGADAVLRLNGDALDAVESFRVEAPSLLLRGNAAFGRGTRLDRLVITEGVLEASRFTGDARPPQGANGQWMAALRGPVLDLRRAFPERSTAPPTAQAAASAGPAIALDARFDRVLIGPEREIAAMNGSVVLDQHGVVREGRVAGRVGQRGDFHATMTPQGQGRALSLTAEDAGALLHTFDVLQHLEGGRLSVSAQYAHNARGAPLAGTADMNDFQVRNAPAFGKLLQAMTLFGLFEAMSTQGLGFSRLNAPFTLTPETLTLGEARAYSASLGLTARGTLDRRRQSLAMEGTIVPAYIFNSLLGNIPLIGRIFSPEAGGGLFAATFRLNGPLADPQVSVNPLAALTPGFLRRIFDIGQPPQQ